MNENFYKDDSNYLSSDVILPNEPLLSDDYNNINPGFLLEHLPDFMEDIPEINLGDNIQLPDFNHDILSDETSNNNIINIMNDITFKNELQKISNDQNIDYNEVNKEAEKYLKGMYSTHDKFTDQLFINIFKTMIDLGFETKVDLNYQDLKRLTELMNKHPVAFITSHKSYLDLVIFLIVLGKCELPLPFVFAGDNLNIPIFGDIWRKNGFIYIKRQIKDNIIYKATLKHFINWLLEQKNSHFVWSIEGGRSRTGKLMDPKIGILKYLSNENIKYVPVSIVYDLIPDLDGMLTEIQGKNKKPESVDWLMSYIKKITSENSGKISIRFGDSMDPPKYESDLTDFSYSIIRSINNITPITTISLISNALLNKITITEVCLINTVVNLMNIIQSKNGSFVDTKTTTTKSVQRGIELMIMEDILRKQGDRYIINHHKFFQTTYYSNLSVHYFYHRAFIELGLLKIKNIPIKNRKKIFWKEISYLRKLFTFEFFYSNNFMEEMAIELKNFTNGIYPDDIFNFDINIVLKDQKILVCPVVLSNYLNSYKIITEALLKLPDEPIDDKNFIQYCMFLSEEMHWLGKIKNVESINTPFLYNGIRLIKKLNLWPGSINNNNIDNNNNNNTDKTKQIKQLSENVDKLLSLINDALLYNLEYKSELTLPLIEKPKPNSLTYEILNGENGSHIGVFFDLDKTLIKGYSAWSFFKNKLTKKMGGKDIVGQITTFLGYLQDRGKYGDIISKTAKNIKGIYEKDFKELGAEIYMKEIRIYRESYELIEAHKIMGHTVCIITAATAYQVEPIAKKLGIDIIECTQLEVNDGKFTGNVSQLCWGEGKADSGRKLAEKYGLNLNKSYFYTDSSEDTPLLKIVGNPRPINPDLELIKLSSNEGWPVQKFEDSHETIFENTIRTALAYASLIPQSIGGYNTGGVEGMLHSVSDVISSIGGMILNVTGEENIWKYRPCVFILNHQSYIDMVICIKLMKKNVIGIAKKEVKNIPFFGKLLEENGTIFIDNTNREKAIEDLKPAVDSLKKGTSVVIFPEGTRSFDYTLGPFKKGAFHMAMQSNVPIVPIVLKNSHDIIPRGSSILRPGIVNIVVHEAISTSDWTLDNMNEKIDQIRKIYLKDLNQL